MTIKVEKSEETKQPEADTVKVRCVKHHFKARDGQRFYKDDVREISKTLAEELVEEGKVENV